MWNALGSDKPFKVRIPNEWCAPGDPSTLNSHSRQETRPGSVDGSVN